MCGVYMLCVRGTCMHKEDRGGHPVSSIIHLIPLRQNSLTEPGAVPAGPSSLPALTVLGLKTNDYTWFFNLGPGDVNLSPPVFTVNHPPTLWASVSYKQK